MVEKIVGVVHWVGMLVNIGVTIRSNEVEEKLVGTKLKTVEMVVKVVIRHIFM